MTSRKDFEKTLATNDFVDVLDITGKWCVAEIKSVDRVKNTVTVHFDGWSSAYDTEISVDSTRLAPYDWLLCFLSTSSSLPPCFSSL
jgi:hypothetical protein